MLRSDRSLGAIVLGAILGLMVAYLIGAWWTGGEAYLTVSEAVSRHEGTGSLTRLGRAVAAVTVYLLGAGVPILPAALIGASPTGRRRPALLVLIVTVTLTSVLGFTLAAGAGGEALVRDAWLHDGYEEYTGRVRQAYDHPPLSLSDAERLVLPAYLAVEATPATSPIMDGPAYLLIAVTLGALVGYGIGTVYRRRRRQPVEGPG